MRIIIPSEYDERIVKRFLFLPKYFYNEGQYRWFEYVTATQRYCDWGNGVLGWKYTSVVWEAKHE